VRLGDIALTHGGRDVPSSEFRSRGSVVDVPPAPDAADDEATDYADESSKTQSALESVEEPSSDEYLAQELL